MAIWKNLRLPPGAARTIKILGYVIRYTDDESLLFLFEEIFVHHCYRKVMKCRGNAPTIIDAGANIGLATLYFKMHFRSARILAFEPDPETFELLRTNLDTWGLTDVMLRNEALSDIDGQAQFSRGKRTAGSLIGHILSQNSDETADFTIQTTRLSRFISQPVDFLKIDIEGAEDLVFMDLEITHTLPMVRAFVVEYNHSAKKPVQDFLKRLQDQPFSLAVSPNPDQAGAPMEPINFLIEGDHR